MYWWQLVVYGQFIMVHNGEWVYITIYDSSLQFMMFIPVDRGTKWSKKKERRCIKVLASFKLNEWEEDPSTPTLMRVWPLCLLMGATGVSRQDASSLDYHIGLLHLVPAVLIIAVMPIQINTIYTWLTPMINHTKKMAKIWSISVIREVFTQYNNNL